MQNHRRDPLKNAFLTPLKPLKVAFESERSVRFRLSSQPADWHPFRFPFILTEFVDRSRSLHTG